MSTGNRTSKSADRSQPDANPKEPTIKKPRPQPDADPERPLDTPQPEAKRAHTSEAEDARKTLQDQEQAAKTLRDQDLAVSIQVEDEQDLTATSGSKRAHTSDDEEE